MFRLVYRSVRIVIAVFAIGNGLIHKIMSPLGPKKK